MTKIECITLLKNSKTYSLRFYERNSLESVLSLCAVTLCKKSEKFHGLMFHNHSAPFWLKNLKTTFFPPKKSFKSIFESLCLFILIEKIRNVLSIILHEIFKTFLWAYFFGANFAKQNFPQNNHLSQL